MDLSREEVIDYLHDLVNKNSAVLGYFKMLQKRDLNDEQNEIAQKGVDYINQSLEILKDFRSKIK